MEKILKPKYVMLKENFGEPNEKFDDLYNRKYRFHIQNINIKSYGNYYLLTNGKVIRIKNNKLHKIKFKHPIVKISAGKYHTIFLDSFGKVYGCGKNLNGQFPESSQYSLDNPVMLNVEEKIADINSPYKSTFLLTENGEVYHYSKIEKYKGLQNIKTLGKIQGIKNIKKVKKIIGYLILLSHDNVVHIYHKKEEPIKILNVKKIYTSSIIVHILDHDNNLYLLSEMKYDPRFQRFMKKYYTTSKNGCLKYINKNNRTIKKVKYGNDKQAIIFDDGVIIIYNNFDVYETIDESYGIIDVMFEKKKVPHKLFGQIFVPKLITNTYFLSRGGLILKKEKGKRILKKQNYLIFKNNSSLIRKCIIKIHTFYYKQIYTKEELLKLPRDLRNQFFL